MPGYQSCPARRWLFTLACLATLALPACAGFSGLPSLLGGSTAGGAWNGTITISRAGESTETTGAGTCCTDITQKTLKDVVTAEVVNSVATGRVSYTYAEHLIARQAYDLGTFDITGDTVIAGSGVDTQRSHVSVSLAEDGSYEIEVDVPPVDGTWTRDGRSILTCNYPPPGCTPDDSQAHDTAPSLGLSGASEVVDGQMTPGGPAVLSGTKAEQFLFKGSIPATLTISWNLVRK